GDQLDVLEVLLRDALGQVGLDLAVGLGCLHLGGELVAGLAAVHRLLQPRDDVAVADQDRQRAAALGGFERLATLLGDGIVEEDDAVFLEFHAVTRSRPDGGPSRGAGSTTGRWRRRGLPSRPGTAKLSA